MKIEKVYWKNFNSYGNVVQSIDLTNDGELYLLAGPVGSGKTTIAEVITYAIYGTVEKKNKSDLPNRINKNLWCKVDLISKNKKVEIIRGIAPNLFEVYIDGVQYETSGNSNVQDYLDAEIFDIPYQVFKNIIVLSINDFKSFLTMSPADKRNIIDRLFGFTIINEMRESVKNDRKRIKEKLKTINDELNVITESIASIKFKLKEVLKDKVADNEKLIAEYTAQINELTQLKQKTVENINTIKNNLLNDVQTSLDSQKSSHTKLKYDITTIENKLKLYSNSKCPTCESDLHTDEHVHIKHQFEISLNEKKVTYQELNANIAQLQSKLEVINKKVAELNQLMIKTDVKLKQSQTELLAAQKNLGIKPDATHFQQLILEHNGKVDERTVQRIELQSEDNFLEVVESVLGDGGVKNMAMKTILPSLNVNISNMAQQIHLPYTIKFNDKFDCIIHSMGEEINPRSMSTGERKKSDFIIIIALLKLLKVRYPSLNLLFLDEIFSSIDASGVYEIIKILNDIVKENQINTWVINHSELPTELFDKRAEVYKDGAFSKLKIDLVS